MIAVRRAAVNTGAAAPTLSFIRWQGREYLRIKTERGVFFYDGEKSLLSEKGFAGPSPADISEPGPVGSAEMQELHPMPRLSVEPDSPERDIPGFEPSARHPGPPRPSESAPEPGGKQPKDDDPSPGW